MCRPREIIWEELLQATRPSRTARARNGVIHFFIRKVWGREGRAGKSVLRCRFLLLGVTSATQLELRDYPDGRQREDRGQHPGVIVDQCRHLVGLPKIEKPVDLAGEIGQGEDSAKRAQQGGGKNDQDPLHFYSEEAA